MRNTCAEKVPSVTVGSTRVGLTFKKASTIQFQRKNCNKMVASKQVEFPSHRGFDQKRARGSDSLAQVAGISTIHFLTKHIVPAAKRVSDVLMEFTVPEIAEVANGRKSLKSAAKSLGRHTSRKQLGSDNEQRKVILEIYKTSHLVT